MAVERRCEAGRFGNGVGGERSWERDEREWGGFVRGALLAALEGEGGDRAMWGGGRGSGEWDRARVSLGLVIGQGVGRPGVWPG